MINPRYKRVFVSRVLYCTASTRVDVGVRVISSEIINLVARLLSYLLLFFFFFLPLRSLTLDI